jgi:hypothetical protein
MQNVLPAQTAAYELLSPLFGDGLEVKKAASTGGVQPAYIAMFIRQDESPGAAGLCSKEFAAYAGAALSMLPPNAAKDAVKSGSLTEMMIGNLYEVMNICSRLLFTDDTPHLRLTKVTSAAEAEGMAQLKEGASIVEFDVTIPKYGTGRLGFLVN